MNALRGRARLLLILCGSSSGLGCSEFRARQHAREGNHYYLEGNYAAAVSSYTQAEQLHPLAVISFNKGLACRQLMTPGAKSPENERATACALGSFQRLKQQNPRDARADALYQQTLFDADRFDDLARLYTAELQRNAQDPAALNGLVQVYSSAGRWEEALHWTVERAQREPTDAEAQYAVGVLVYNRLAEKGGGQEQSSYDPRPQGAAAKVPPPAMPGDITGAARIALAQEGIAYLEKAEQIRPNYAEALTYSGLLYRQLSFAYFDRPVQWQAAVDRAEDYRKRATTLHAAHTAAQP